MTKLTHPDSTYRQWTYDVRGLLLTDRNELGNVWTRTYTEYQQVSTITDPLNRTTTYEYGREPGCATCAYLPTLSRITRPSGKVTEMHHDLSGKLIFRVEGVGTADEATTSTTYNTAGLPWQVTDPLNHTSTYTYDLLHRQLSVTDPLSHTTSWTYDAVGNRLTETRPDAGVIANTYDAMNRLTSTTNPNNETTTFTYWNDDSLATLTDARSNTYSFQVDALSRRTRMTYPGGSYEAWTYDSAGNNVTYTTRAGQVKTCTFDNRNRDTLCDWSDTTPDVTKTYDAAGRILTMVNSVSALSYTYDTANQLLSETQDLNAPVNLPPKTVSYTYDADGNRASLTYPDGTVVTYTYTGRNQMAEITADGPPPLATYSYDLAGNRIGKTLENGTSTAYTYDNANRLLSIEHRKAGVPFQRFDYTLNDVGNRTARVETNNSIAQTDVYGYDAADQVTQVKYDFNAATNTQTRLVSYAYDAVGNRTTVTDNGIPTPYTTNALNQYTSIDSLAAPTYDLSGNLTTLQAKPSDPVWTYTYDAQNRLIGGSSSTSGSFSFAYDARNRCVARTINGTTTLYYFDEWNLLDERTAADVQQAEYVHGAMIDELLTITTAATTAYYNHDGLGSTTALSDATGALLETVSYDVYGAATLRAAAGNVIAASTVSNRFLFTGRERFASAELYDYRNRVYSAEAGRFLQTDPIRFSAKDINIYRYALNSPARSADPLGLNAEDPIGAPNREIEKCNCKRTDIWYEQSPCNDTERALAAAECKKQNPNADNWGATDCSIYQTCKCVDKNTKVCLPTPIPGAPPPAPGMTFSCGWKGISLPPYTT